MQQLALLLVVSACVSGLFATDARAMSQKFMIECHSDVTGFLADLLIDRDTFGLNNPQAIRVMERNHKLFTAFALVAGFANPKDRGRAYLAKVFKRGEAKYKVIDGKMVGPDKAAFVKEFVARNAKCKQLMRRHPKFKLIPRHLTD